MHLNIVHSEELDSWLSERHYLHNTPAGAVIRMEFTDDDGNRIGAMMWGRNPSPKQEQRTVLCLTRMYFEDDTERFVESSALAMARKHIRKHCPDVVGLVAYSSTGEGHEGTVYKADRWFAVQSSSRDGATDTRPGRKNTDTSKKIKWVRSP